MIKEKDYPHFCKPEGKEKFEAFVKDFNIVGSSKLPRSKHYEFFKDGSYLNTEGSSAFDHVSFWQGEENWHDVYYAVSQYYGTAEMAIEELRKHKRLARAAYKYGYKVTVYDNSKYNWHNDNTVFILFQLNDPKNPFYEPEPPELEIEIK